MGERRKEEGGRREGVRGEVGERRTGEEGGKEGEEGREMTFVEGLQLAPTNVVLTRLWLQHDLCGFLTCY